MLDAEQAKWTTLKDEQGREYIFNEETRETRWLWATHTDPTSKREYRANALTGKTEWLAQDEAETDAKNAEVVCTAKDGRKYVYNSITRESRWLPTHGASSPGRAKLDPEEAAGFLGRAFRAFRAKLVLLKLRFLSGALNDTMEKLRVSDIDIQKLSEETDALFALSQIDSGSEQHQRLRAVHQRLLAASEAITQGTIAVDGVSSDGSDVVRARRKNVVKMLLSLGEQTDGLKARANQRLQEIPAPDGS
uniref:WW domain-containing protein n=1 Tax=Erythrolobus australicus TaxID=1077150 RepID=A0A7S1TJU8_9RHOD|mmetsp:Transcript_2032/g.5410  ORF Transcript_2032/g.5410 Transcript_2032/m.5410 type:complete len:249 (+) Transcript_2032:260-1006(+)